MSGGPVEPGKKASSLKAIRSVQNQRSRVVRLPSKSAAVDSGQASISGAALDREWKISPARLSVTVIAKVRKVI